jgi:hypothetical protein
MGKSTHLTIDQILAPLNDKDKQTVEYLRSLIKGTLPEVIETVRRGKLTYMLEGRDAAGIRVANGHVDLLFMNCRNLDSTLLKGQGTLGDPKHMEVHTLNNFDATEAKRLLQAQAQTLAALIK